MYFVSALRSHVVLWQETIATQFTLAQIYASRSRILLHHHSSSIYGSYAVAVIEDIIVNILIEIFKKKRFIS